MAVYFKFSSWSKENYDTVVLDTTSPFISVGELKQAIIKKKKIDKSNQLLLTNAQTNEEYKEDSQLIQKNTSVLVRLIPIINQLPQQPATNATASKNPRDPYKRGGNDDDFGTAFWEESNPELAQQEAIQQLPAGTEEDKIFAVINQAGDFPMASLKGQVLKQLPKKIPPVGYVCFRCNQPGHFIYDCPTNGDPNYNFQRKPVTMYGVPKSFLVQNTEGKAFEFKPNEGDFSKLVGGWNKNETQSIPKELTCPLCKKLLNNAVMIPCCNETSCDDCIRSQLMEKTNFHCPLCNSNLVPDQLLPNKAVRRSVESYKIGKPIDTNLISSHNHSNTSSSSAFSSSSSSHSHEFKHHHQISPGSPLNTEIANTESSNISDKSTKAIPESSSIHVSTTTSTSDNNNNKTTSSSSSSNGNEDRSRKRRSPSPYDRHPPSEEYRRYGRAPSDYRDREYDRDRYFRSSPPRRFRRSRSRSPKRRFRSRSPPPPFYRRSRSRSPFRYRDRRDRSRSRSRDRERDRDRLHDAKKRSVDRKEDSSKTKTVSSETSSTSSTTTTSSSSDKSVASTNIKPQEDKSKSTSHSNTSKDNISSASSKDEKKHTSSSSSSSNSSSSGSSSNVKKDSSSTSKRSRSRSRERDRDRSYRRRSKSRERIDRKASASTSASSSSSSDKKNDTGSSSTKTNSSTSNTAQTESKKSSH